MIGDRVSEVLESDAFAHIDANHDGLLSAAEYRVFIESAVREMFEGITADQLKNVKIQYPVLKITKDMSADKVERICEMVQTLENDLEFEVEKMKKDPSLLMKAAMDVAKRPNLNNMNFGEFDSFLRTDVMPLSDELIIPEECKQLAIPTRRKTFLGVTILVAASIVGPTLVAGSVAVGAGGGAAIEECVRNGCDGADQAFHKHSGYVWDTYTGSEANGGWDQKMNDHLDRQRAEEQRKAREEEERKRKEREEEERKKQERERRIQQMIAERRHHDRYGRRE